MCIRIMFERREVFDMNREDKEKIVIICSYVFMHFSQNPSTNSL